MFQKIVILTALVFLWTKVLWSGAPITIDGLFDDWAMIPVATSDIFGDGNVEDFAELKITNDNNFLFLKVSFHNQEHLLQDLNRIRLYIDTDNNRDTGIQINEMGAELEWCFGCREGIHHSQTGSITIGQADIVLRSAPTITAKDFELAISLRSAPMISSATQIPDTITIVLETTDALDLIPDQPGGYQYVIDTSSVESPTPIPLKREQEEHLRILTYNTLAYGLLNLGRQENFKRIIQALKPDIMAFQEQGQADQSISLIRDWFQERYMYGVGLGNNNLVVSRYPILNHALITGSGRTMAVLLQTESVLGKNLLLLNSHLACCTNNASRQHDADEIISVLRNWYAGNGPFELEANTPIVHLGDFNLVGDSQQLKTLTEGDVVDELSFGSDFFPDWDNTPLTDLFSLQTSIRMGYTWRNDNESFNPGKLDYILFTDSNIELGNHFVLNTLAMSDDELDRYGLLSNDTNGASDHLPRVMDIASVIAASIEDKVEIPHRFKLFQAFPNPFNPKTIINYELQITNDINLSIYNVRGQKVATLVSEKQSVGYHQVEWDASGFASGIYYYELKAGGFREFKKMVLMK